MGKKITDTEMLDWCFEQRGIYLGARDTGQRWFLRRSDIIAAIRSERRAKKADAKEP